MNNLKLQLDFLKKLHKGNTILTTLHNDKLYISDGYAAYLLENNFLNLDNVKKRDNLINDILSKNNVEIEFTNNIKVIDSVKKELYVFKNKDTNIYVDKKLFKYLDKLYQYTFKGDRPVDPIECYKNGKLEAVILPVRVTE